MPRQTTFHPWSKAKRALAFLLRVVRESHPQWTIEDLRQQLGEDFIPTVSALAGSAGFHSSIEPTEEDVAIVETCFNAGVHDPKLISASSKIPLARVMAALGRMPAPYGISPYGSTAYGGNRQVSDGIEAVPRKITAVGQLYYRGRRYCLGIRYRARLCKVLERDKKLFVSFEDQDPVWLTRRL